jgi:hypothetical protein
MNLFKREEQETAQFNKEHEINKRKLFKAIVQLRKHFRSLGQTKLAARANVNQLLESLANETFLYSLGAVNYLETGVNSSTLPFMNQAAKDVFLQKIQ